MLIDFKFWLETVLSPIALCGWMLTALLVVTFWKCRSRLMRGMALGVWALFFCATLPLTADPLLGSLEHWARRDQTCGAPPPGSIFIVLAGGVHGEPDSRTDFTALMSSGIRRQLAATRIALQTPDSRMLISGGGGGGGRWREADVMGALAEQLGFPRERIQLDRHSRTTYQSAIDTARLLAGDTTHPRYLLTSAYHMPRAYMAFRDSGQAVCALPVDFQHFRRRPFAPFTPQLDALARMNLALHEYIGIAFYRWVKFEKRKSGSE